MISSEIAAEKVAAANSVSHEQLRTFYLTGRGLDEFRPQGPLRPAVLDQIGLPRVERSYPLYAGGGEAPRPFFQVLHGLIDAHRASFPMLRDRLELVVGVVAEAMGSRACVALSDIVDGALAAGSARWVAEDAATATEFDLLRKTLPREGWLIAFCERAPLLLACALLQTARRQARTIFVRELKETAQRLEELLAIDDRKSVSASSTEQLAASLGAGVASFLDAGALAEALQRRANPLLAMEPERRARCEGALVSLQFANADFERLPTVVVLHSGRAPEVATSEFTPEIAARFEHADDVCEAAVSTCRRQLNHHLLAWKALRVARLELESVYDPAIHSEMLAAFDWTMVQEHELAALPVVVAVAATREIEESLSSFRRLLQSGLPVQVLIASPGDGENLGCLPMDYQESFSLHSSIASPDHLIAGLQEMAKTLRPAVAVVGVSESWIAASLLGMARVWPLYRYHPELGESWYERFAMRLEGIDGRLILAHATALMPGPWRHFRVLPEEAGSLDKAFPFLPVTEETGSPCRAVFTRELANASAAAQRRWLLLAELAAPKAQKTADPESENRARLEGATQAIQRVIALLTP